MISTEIFIVKRDGKKEVFSLDKIKNAIAKAFLSVGSRYPGSNNQYPQPHQCQRRDKCGRYSEPGGSCFDGRTLLCGSKVIYAISSETSGRPGS